jgi:hypothetical protein
MKTHLTKLALALTALNRVEGEDSSTDSSAAASNAEKLNRRSIERRAVEAVIWGMPIVNFDRMLQAAIQCGGAANQVIYWSQPVNWQNQTLTPNPDTIYFNPFYDTRKGPMVLEIPPTDESGVIVGSADTAWQNALVDVGRIKAKVANISSRRRAMRVRCRTATSSCRRTPTKAS